jgi:hypothetical protein
MYVLLFVLIQAWVAFYCINPYLLLFLVLVYVPWYLDGKEFSGERRWTWFRRLFIWKWLSPVEYTFANISDLSLLNHTTKRVYVMVPGDTLIALVWGVGLHGGQLPFAEYLHFVVPPLLMWIPLLRDVLMWMGAVTYHHKKRPLESVIFALLHSNRSVCYCPSNFANMALAFSTEEDSEEHDLEKGMVRQVPSISEETLAFALEEKIQLVPVVVHGERRRYYIFTHAVLLRRIQVAFYNLIGYPFPLFFWPKMFSHSGRPPKLQQQFGSIIECNQKYANTIVLKESFQSAVSALISRELGDDELKLM